LGNFNDRGKYDRCVKLHAPKSEPRTQKAAVTKVPVNYPSRGGKARNERDALWALVIQMVLTRRWLIDWRTLSSTSAKLITGYLTTNLSLSPRLIKKRLSAARGARKKNSLTSHTQRHFFLSFYHHTFSISSDAKLLCVHFFRLSFCCVGFREINHGDQELPRAA
jgi:hypothetical protein